MADDPLTQDNLLTAARRVVRFFRINNERDGGMISNETTQAVDDLEKHVRQETLRIKRERGDEPRT